MADHEEKPWPSQRAQAHENWEGSRPSDSDDNGLSTLPKWKQRLLAPLLVALSKPQGNNSKSK